jgi:hypothetical protein
MDSTESFFLSLGLVLIIRQFEMVSLVLMTLALREFLLGHVH